MVYAEVAMNIAEEYDFFGVVQESTPHLPVATVVTEDDLENCLQWQRHIAEADSPDAEAPSREISAGDITIAPSSLSIHPSAQLDNSAGETSMDQSKLSPLDPPSYLNKEQSMAFTIIAEHIYRLLNGEDPPQLLMVIHGLGGMGKTRLLKAITKMFSDMGIADRFAKTALTGVAACQIGGKTLHSWGTLPAVAGMRLKETEQLPTMLRLVKGMQVMVTRNLATTANLSNGSRGRVVDIKLDVREDGITDEDVAARKVFLHYPPALVILELNFCELPPLPGLGERQVPLTPEKFKFTIGSSPSTTVTRRQLALTPAYAFTDFKSQGQTIEHVLVDVGRTTCFNLSPFNVYVALSRSRGRDTIRLLRDFDNDLFLRHPSEDLRIEERRIDGLVEETTKLFDSTHT
ncbi:hypothetical protein DFJ58DRAFT_730013 [Suillus subalutaceus]|uniref:uncharacterized protein n=1 Tax=Suillus subalutaceus TaxID=48586 RepID=UPI001B866C45|nr:uncharacterized protein DFJ58DRAFT_730013 [Suillus subalutaceus]KAG1847831.1 hypothetical protein DFJ58DRAFT_730013 [Suillus subalutaceus]